MTINYDLLTNKLKDKTSVEYRLLRYFYVKEVLFLKQMLDALE